MVHDVKAQTVLLSLVAPHDEVEPVGGAEGLRDVPAKLDRVLAPGGAVHAENAGACLVVLDWVGPEDVPEPLVLRTLKVVVGEWPPDAVQIVDGPLAVADAAVQREDPASDQSRQWQVLECLLDGAVGCRPSLRAEGLAGLLEAVALVHVVVLVVAAVQKDVVRVEDLQREEDGDHLQLVLAPVHKVAVEDHGRALRRAGHAEGVEKQQHVAELAVDVPEYLAGQLADLGEGRLRGKHC
eukprot:CAMPEP_0171160812 /NCGR_PEP_ID=MMETSP0790-20130122/3749_1 /TAXON_ID=2925 /ORGANISM="Alexandrium catenella, Strain OF101" /LENGTH=238 /DNA_ID=CAMNT_0011625355 /DNA_START=119 /DNA_END=832 /DNA_ORIENTATION=+